jgi:ABC-type glycerol-3-phosphate transport system substrate-binding protein
MNSKLKMLLAAALAGTLLAACGGDSSGDGGGAIGGGGSGAIDPSRSTKSVFDFISKLIAENGENSDAIDVNALTLAADETSEPEPFP